MSSQEPPIPAAEYLRMSTNDQPNSIPLQKAAIRRYAIAHGFEVIAVYADEVKSPRRQEPSGRRGLFIALQP